MTIHAETGQAMTRDQKSEPNHGAPDAFAERVTGFAASQMFRKVFQEDMALV